jgi:hypothetical protein
VHTLAVGLVLSGFGDSWLLVFRVLLFALFQLALCVAWSQVLSVSFAVVYVSLTPALFPLRLLSSYPQRAQTNVWTVVQV